MALDQFGNYICDISPVPVSPLPGSMNAGNLTSDSDPEGTIEADLGTVLTLSVPPYSIYVKTIDGGTTGWILKVE